MQDLIQKSGEILALVPNWLRILVGVISVVSAMYLCAARYHKWKASKKKRRLIENNYAATFLGQFNEGEIERFLDKYVIPKCAPNDPTNRDGEEYLADIQQSIFDYMDSNLEQKKRSYNLILADTGMGKTMFCLNYFAHSRKKNPDLNICLVSLASKSAESLINSVLNKAETLLIADAFDEDPYATGRGKDRLSEILEASADFRAVVITCRSQYFLSDDAIPRETPLPILVPRELGQSQNSSLIRSYIAPFSRTEVQAYIAKHFPLYKFWLAPQRKRARALVEAVPDLSHRPMLLERLPDLARQPSKSTEIYDLYDLLIEGWLRRESRWITFENLRAVSLELAIRMYEEFNDRRGRLSKDEINQVAENLIHKNPEWKYLTSRSLLNRDSEGHFKFAHKSILEFLVVKSVCENDDRGLHVPWTAFMKEIFISWGHSEKGKGRWQRARSILASDYGRKHVTPLFDLLGTTAVRGYPNFKDICDRRNTSTGERLAPASWRESSIQVAKSDSGDLVQIFDREYNLVWSYIPNQIDPEIVDARLVDALHFERRQPSLRFPSFEQFVTLAEGLYKFGEDILRDGSLFVLQDKPGKHYQLLVQLNSDIIQSPILKPLCKMVKISGTKIYINCYQASAVYSPQYATDLLVDQLYIDDERDSLFSSPILRDVVSKADRTIS